MDNNTEIQIVRTHCSKCSEKTSHQLIPDPKNINVAIKSQCLSCGNIVDLKDTK